MAEVVGEEGQQVVLAEHHYVESSLYQGHSQPDCLASHHMGKNSLQGPL
jgi:hypothetical protein